MATVPLVLTGLGFGLALAPVNAALLGATAAAVHGVTQRAAGGGPDGRACWSASRR